MKERGERQPLPDVWDILERKVRLSATKQVRAKPGGEKKYSREENARFWAEFREKRCHVEGEKWELREKGTVREGLILDLYQELAKGSDSFAFTYELSPARFQRFRSQVEPMSAEEIATELRRVERKHDMYRRMVETRNRSAWFTSEERAKRDEEQREKRREWRKQWSQTNPEKRREQQRRTYQRRKERERLRAEQQQPSEVFSPKK